MNGAESVQVIATLVAAIAILGWVITSLVRSRNSKPSTPSSNPGIDSGIASDIGIIKERLTSIVKSNERQEETLGRIERNMPKARKR